MSHASGKIRLQVSDLLSLFVQQGVVYYLKNEIDYYPTKWKYFPWKIKVTPLRFPFDNALKGTGQTWNEWASV